MGGVVYMTFMHACTLGQVITHLLLRITRSVITIRGLQDVEMGGVVYITIIHTCTSKVMLGGHRIIVYIYIS